MTVFLYIYFKSIAIHCAFHYNSNINAMNRRSSVHFSSKRVSDGERAYDKVREGSLGADILNKAVGISASQALLCEAAMRNKVVPR